MSTSQRETNMKHVKLCFKAGKGSAWSKGRQEEWLGRKAAFQAEEMEGAESGSRRGHDSF